LLQNVSAIAIEAVILFLKRWELAWIEKDSSW